MALGKGGGVIRSVGKSWGWLALMGSGSAVVGATFVSPSAAPARTEVASASSSECGSCHTEELSGWMGSMHQRAWLDPLVHHEMHGNERAYCRDCHNPTGAAEEGITCVDCHVRDGELVAAGTSAEAQEAHPLRVDPDFAGPATCEGCHQFQFPGAHQVERLRYDPNEWLQDTHAEWRGSEAALRGEDCASCHGVHRLRGLDDPELLSEAVAIEARRVGEGRVIVRLTAGRIGHDFPTGDVFRQVEVAVWDASNSESRDTVYLGRVFSAEGSVDGLSREVIDNRVPVDGRRSVALQLEGEPESLGWSVSLLRMSPQRARVHGVSDQMNRITLERGEL